MLGLAESPLYLTHSGWNALLPKREPAPPLTTDIKVKYVVVGAGYAGLSAARRLSELDPQSRIAGLDAGVVGEGASGRNSGFMQPVRPSDAGEQFQRLAESGRKATRLVLSLIEENGIDCGLERGGSLRCAATKRGEAELRSNARSYEANGLAYEFLDRDAVTRKIGTDYYNFALFAGDGYFVQPAALVRGYADLLPAQVELHEKTRVIGLRRDGDWILSTSSGGTVRAEVVVLAVNSFARQLRYPKDLGGRRLHLRRADAPS